MDEHTTDSTRAPREVAANEAPAARDEDLLARDEGGIGAHGWFLGWTWVVGRTCADVGVCVCFEIRVFWCSGALTSRI